jgi:D-cysteine desulfhydrase
MPARQANTSPALPRVEPDALPLLARFPELARRVPWISLGDWPTPVTEACHFAVSKGLRALYVKREDLSHPLCGGNKVRGLEFLLADALHRGASTLLTFGVVTIAVLIDQPPTDCVRSNLLTAASADATFVPAGRLTLLPKFAVQFANAWLRQGRRPYYVPLGGTSRLACLGHVSAALELKSQVEGGRFPEPDYLYVPLGSLGTAAGLAVGCKIAGLRTRLVGVVVSYRWYCTAARWARMARRIHRLMSSLDPAVPDIRIEASELSVVPTALGEGYARPTEPARRLAREFQEAEGIELDGTYTAKTLHGAVNHIDEHQTHDKVHLFWHTYHALPVPADSAALVARLPAELRSYCVSGNC